MDLHMHTKYSDGQLTVAQILCRAQELKLEYISITDHNNFDAYNELAENPQTRAIFGGKIIKGTEVFFAEKGLYNEVLGYGFDGKVLAKSPLFDKEIHFNNQSEILKNTYPKFINHGFKLPGLKELTARLRNNSGHLGANIIKDELLNSSDPKNVTLLKELGVSGWKTFYFKLVDNKSSQFYVNTQIGKPSMKEACDAIHAAGGLVFMAHVLRYVPQAQAVKWLDYAVENKLIDGIEVYYYCFTQNQIDFLADYCKKHNLYMSGGSDIHLSSERMCIAAGKPIPAEIIAPWVSKIKTY